MAINPFHGAEIVVNADRPDWGKLWGFALEEDKRCWCWACTMNRTSEWEGRVKIGVRRRQLGWQISSRREDMGCRSWEIHMKQFGCDAPNCSAEVEVQQTSDDMPEGWTLFHGIITCPKHEVVFQEKGGSGEGNSALMLGKVNK